MIRRDRLSGVDLPYRRDDHWVSDPGRSPPDARERHSRDEFGNEARHRAQIISSDPSATETLFPLVYENRHKLATDRMPFDFAEIVGTFAPRAFFASAATGDDDFDVTGVRDVMESAAFVYKLYGAESKLGATYPESPHDFPPAARRSAYAFIDAALK